MKLGFVVDEKDRGKMQETLTFLNPFLSVAGCQFETIEPKNAILNWKNFDMLLLFMDIREEFNRKNFFHFIQKIKSNIPIVNDPDLWLWESDFSRFQQYESYGVNIVPTIKCHSLKAFSNACGILNSERLYVWSGSDNKTIFTAGSDDLFNYTNNSLANKQHVVVQPYFSSIETQGTLSFFFFGGEFSHSVKHLNGETFRFTPSDSEMEKALYSMNSTLDAFSFNRLSSLAVAPLVSVIDFVFHEGSIVQLDQRFFPSDLALVRNPIGAANFTKSILEQINNFKDLGRGEIGAFH